MTGDRNIISVDTYNAIVGEYCKFKAKDKETYYSELEKFEKLIPKGARILDAGCGIGTQTEYFSKRSFDIIGIDAAKDMLEKAKEFLPNCEFMQMDIRDLKFKEEFDAILCLFVLYHLEREDLSKALKEIKRVLKPGGIVLIAVGKGDGEVFGPDPWAPDKKMFYILYKKDELVNKVKEEGFKILDVSVRKGNAPWPEIFVYAKK